MIKYIYEWWYDWKLTVVETGWFFFFFFNPFVKILSFTLLYVFVTQSVVVFDATVMFSFFFFFPVDELIEFEDFPVFVRFALCWRKFRDLCLWFWQFFLILLYVLLEYSRGNINMQKHKTWSVETAVSSITFMTVISWFKLVHYTLQIFFRV